MEQVETEGFVPEYRRDTAEAADESGGFFKNVSARITKRKTTSAPGSRMHEALLLLQNYENTGQGWFWSTDASGQITYLTGGVSEMLGKDPSALLQTPFASLFLPAAGNTERQRTLPFILVKQSKFDDLPLQAATDSEERWWAVSGQPQYDPSGNFAGYLGSGTDITAQRRKAEDSSRLTTYDSLTGLLNRFRMSKLLETTLAAFKAQERSCAIMLIDLDRFKQVNDTLGHGVGDELLRLIALRLTRALRPNDAVGRTAGPGQLAARIGGDEFVVVLEGIHGRDDASAVARRLLDVLSHPYEIGAHRLHSSASIGIVTTEHATGSAEDALRDADIAMYEAKRAGRARFVMFEPTMHEQARRSLSLENDLRRALVGGELFVVYQPVLNLQTGRPTGIEALARWQHPTRGLVPPAEFIPVAEASGLIGAVGNLVLETACQQMVQWQRSLGEHCPEMMAVNLSRAQLGEPGLVDEVRQVLQRSGLDARHLKLEITESLAAQDETVQATLRDLKSLGLRLALDDFGTGYSSLACLHLLPVDTVKIDRSFVSQIETSEYHRVLIEATIRVAATLGMSTVAEGIETAGQADLLLQLNCEKGQGYLYSKPLRSDELAHWMTGIGRRHERSVEAGSPARAAAVGDRQRADHAVHATPD